MVLRAALELNLDLSLEPCLELRLEFVSFSKYDFDFFSNECRNKLQSDKYYEKVKNICTDWSTKKTECHPCELVFTKKKKMQTQYQRSHKSKTACNKRTLKKRPYFSPKTYQIKKLKTQPKEISQLKLVLLNSIRLGEAKCLLHERF